MYLGVQTGEVEPFVCELLTGLTAIIQDLETHQIHMFFEAVGLMIAAEADIKRRELYLVRYKCLDCMLIDARNKMIGSVSNICRCCNFINAI